MGRVAAATVTTGGDGEADWFDDAVEFGHGCVVSSMRRAKEETKSGVNVFGKE